MSTGLEIARVKRKEMAATGQRPDRHVTFSGTTKAEGFDGSEVDLIEKAIYRLGPAHKGGVIAFVKQAALKAALEAANKPVVERSTKSVEELEAEMAKLQARIEKKKGT